MFNLKNKIMIQRVILFESVNKTDDSGDVLVIARQTDGRILNVDTPEAIVDWYLKCLKEPVSSSDNSDK